MEITITANLSPEVMRQIAEKCAEIVLKKQGVKPSLVPVGPASNKTYSTRQVASFLGVTKATVQIHCEKGIIEASKPGKSWIITHDNYLKYLENNKNG